MKYRTEGPCKAREIDGLQLRLLYTVHYSQNGPPSCPQRVLCHEHAGPNGMCNCTRDGGGPFEVGNQVLVSSHRKLLWSKAMVVSVAENRNEIPAGKIERGERKQTVGEVSKAD